MLPNASVLYILTYRCDSRHSGVQFFDICSSKSGPYPSAFSHFHLQMRFAPQRRASFGHLTFKNWSAIVVFLCILIYKCASRPSGVRFLEFFGHLDLQMRFAPLHIRTSKIGPRLWCFVHFDLKICFAPQWCAIFHLSAEQLLPHPPL